MKKSDFVIVKQGAFVGLNTESGRVVLPCEYDKILDYDDDGYVRFIKDGIYGTVDLKGNVCIPLTKRLTHLGVFHRGSARAKIDGKWGLVDVYGNSVGEFVYKYIDAHRNYGYSAFLLDGTHGTLSENGVFRTSEDKMSHNKYRFVGEYHNNVAPALTKYEKWVFVDKNLYRINDVEYWWLDYVPGQDVYVVGKSLHNYSLANYEGVLIIDKWFYDPLKFDNGLAVCVVKDIYDSDNKTRRYGVVNLNGEYLFEPEYTSLYWNNDDKRDCWFAEDDKWAYLLFLDGSRKIYARDYIVYDNGKAYIPGVNIDKYMKGDEPKVVVKKHDKVFYEDFFLHNMNNRMKSLKFYYRDTDADVDVKALYKKGRFICTDTPLEVTQKLKRPVHRIRFLIATKYIIKIEKDERRQNKYGEMGFKENVIPAGSTFLVYDVQHIGGVTQVVLLYFPHGAMLLAKEFKVKYTKYKPKDINDVPLKKAAEQDLINALGQYIHGHSLNDDWCERMYRPVGCNEMMKLNKLVMTPYPESMECLLMNDCDERWSRDMYYR